MKIRKSVKIFAGLALALGVGLIFSPQLYSYYADAVQYLGLINFQANGQTTVVMGTNTSGAVTMQQSTSTTTGETAVVSFSTPTATTPIMSLTQSGHFLVNNSTAAPTASANCAVTAGSSDAAGSVAISGGATAACTITFGASYNIIPVCVAADSTVTTSTVQTAPTRGTVVLTISGNRNDTIQWICLGH